MKLSLVVATVNRTEELYALFASLAAQPFRNFEVILVDQNRDGRLHALAAEFAPKFPLKHLFSPIANCCLARNLGIEEATGEIIGFPDDDCVYRPDTMLRVMQRFEHDAKLALLGGNCVSPEGRLVNGRWMLHSCEITAETVWTTLQGFAMWMRTDAVRKVKGFDPEIGPGTRWGSSEEPDLALRLLRRGCHAYYDLEIGVLHPDNTMTPHAVERAPLYGAGMGRVLRKHSIPLRIALRYFLRPAGGVLLNLLRARPLAVRYYWRTLRGRLSGYFAQQPHGAMSR